MIWERGNSNLVCYKCQKPVDGPIGFKSICESCFSCLHSCVNCKFYCPGRANNCLVPNTDPISDREANNYCDEFKVKTKADEKPKPKADDIEKRLFKD